MALCMQGRARKIIPAVAAVLVHIVALAGFIGLHPTPLQTVPEEALPIMWIERAQAPPRPLAAPGSGLTLRAPSLAITVPNVSIAVPPAVDLPSMLGEYLTCGVGQALTPEELARCEALRRDLYARPDVPRGPDDNRALEQRFARDKAVQDQPLLRLCQTRSGPDPLCFSPGYETMVGSIAARGAIPLPLNQPIKPRSCAGLFC